MRFASAHSCGLRQWDDARSCAVLTLPQRIRAGCDKTAGLSANEYMLCLSAFVRVATLGLNVNCRVTSFATAHSRGLRRCTTKRTLTQISLPQRIRAGCDQCANNLQQPDGALPQRIRAGCDIKLTVDDVDCYLCHSAFVRVATHCYKLCKIGQTLCLSAFARVATKGVMATVKV